LIEKAFTCRAKSLSQKIVALALVA